MKTYCTLLIVLLSFSFVNAQDNIEVKTIESNVVVSQNNEAVSLSVNDSETVLTNKENDTNEIIVARNSDIRNYLNLVRNVENIDLLFPKINKTVKA